MTFDLLRQFSQRWPRILFGILTVAVFALHAARIVTLPGLDVVERNLYDSRVRWTMPGGVDDRIVILDIDEKSLAEFGRWPWNRARMARINDQLFDRYGVASLGYDVVWAESETQQWATLLAETGAATVPEDLRARIDTDTAFARSLAERPVTLGYYFNNERNAQRKNVLPQPVLTPNELPVTTTAGANWSGFTGNVAVLMDGGTIGGHTNSLREADGVIRRVPMLIRHGGGYYESLSLAMVRQLFGGEPVRPVIAEADGYKRLEAVAVGPLRIPVDGEIATWVSFRGPAYSFRYISLGDVLAGRVPSEALLGKIALIGTSAPGLGDNRATATDEIMPGVEVHANMIAAMLDQNLREQPAYTSGLDVAQVGLLGLLAVLIFAVATPTFGLVGFIATCSAAVGINLLAWNDKLILPLGTALVLLIVLYTVFSAWGFFAEGRAKRQLSSMFGQYVPPKLVAEMAKDPGHYSMESRDAELTVLFSDLRGFTGISEQLDARQLAAYINEYLSRMSAVISAHNGTLDKFIGDAIMAFWGAPVDDADAAGNAVRAAIGMQAEAEKLNAEFLAAGLPYFQIGIGLNSGPMRVGDMGSRLRRAYTVMGDAVNLGSRLEGITKAYDVGILIGEATRALVPDCTCRLVDRVRVKGREAAVEVFEPLGETKSLPAETIAAAETWNAFMAAYFAMEWDLAEALLAKARKLHTPEGLIDLYAERIAYARQNPPPAGWDGVTTFSTK